MIEEIADGVFVQSGRYFQEQRALVRGKKWCTLIDAPQHFDEAEELDRMARDLTVNGVRLAILTHGHLDHTATLQVFTDALVAGTTATRDYMLTKGQKELDRLKQDDDELQRVQQVLPSITFSAEAAFHSDTGRSFRCIPAPGHSDDSLIVFLEPDSILFSGDSLSPVMPPYFPDSSSTRLEETLIGIACLHANTLVPGHGKTLRGLEIAGEISSAVTYIEALRLNVAHGLSEGRSQEELQEQISWSDCSEKETPPEDYLKYHRENVSNMAAELSIR